jgi:polar amino acid transport system substrate-binding protein
MNIIANIYGFNFVYQYKQFSDLIPAVQNDKNTISISSQTDTRAREQLVDFADFFRSGTGFIVRSNYNQVINSLSDLCGKTVAVLATSTFQNDVTNQNANCGGNPITIQTFPSTSQAISAVQNGNADVVLDDDVFIPTVISQSNNQLKVSGQSYGVAPYGILCNKQNQALCCLLVNAINYLIQQGIYEQLLNKYSYTYAKNGICPSRLNIDGTTCLSTCTPTNTFCQSKLS